MGVIVVTESLVVWIVVSLAAWTLGLRLVRVLRPSKPSVGSSKQLCCGCDGCTEPNHPADRKEAEEIV